MDAAGGVGILLGMWTPEDAETIAGAVLSRSKADTASPASPIRIAAAQGVEVRVAPRAHLWGQAKLTRVAGRDVVWVAPGQERRVRWFAVAHELAELELARAGARFDGIEDLANAAAAAILAPRPAFRAAVRAVGRDWTALAEVFTATESCMVLRAGEVLGDGLALVSPALVRVRGEAAWPHADEVRRLARGRDPAVRAARLRDDPRRVVLEVAG